MYIVLLNDLKKTNCICPKCNANWLPTDMNIDRKFMGLFLYKDIVSYNKENITHSSEI